MNIGVLKYIVNEEPHYIEELAEENGMNEQSSLGVARQLIGDEGDVSKLTKNQVPHYEKCIRPLLENVHCGGVLSDGESCQGTGYIDDESLLDSYTGGDFSCQHCRHDSEKYELG